MERRVLFRNMLLMGMGAVLPFRKLLAGGNKTTGAPGLFHRFRLGTLDLMVITDGHIALSPVQPFSAPEAAPAAVDSLLQNSFRSTKEIDLGINILVIKKEKQVILVDTGAGSGFGSGAGWLIRSLADAGIRQDAVTDIVLTHAHPDHIGGLLAKNGQPAFQHAKVHIAAAEHQFWTSDSPDFSKSKAPDKVQLQQMAAAAKKTLTALGNRLVLFDPPAQLFGCIRLQLAPGHTPGHTLVHIFSGEEALVHIADLMHSDVLLFPHPEWGFFGDTDFSLATATRKQVLQELAESRSKVFASHLPWPGIGHVRKKEGAYEWIPETYAVPA